MRIPQAKLILLAFGTLFLTGCEELVVTLEIFFWFKEQGLGWEFLGFLVIGLVIAILSIMVSPSSGRVSKFEVGSMIESEDGRISIAVAEKFIQRKDSVYLEEFSSIDDAAAEILSKHEGWLGLEGLNELSDAAAESLAKHKNWLNLSGLKKLSDSVAESLSKHKGGLQFDGLSELSDEAFGSRSHLRGGLVLRGLTKLSDVAAEYLSEDHVWNRLGW